MRINSMSLGIILLVLIFGGIASTSAMNLWSTTSSKQPAKYTQGAAAGEYDPEDIRGSYTFSEIANLFEIDGAILQQAFDLPTETDLDFFKSKDLETIYEESGVEIGNGSLKVFVALYKDLPMVLAEDYLPMSAVQLIKENNPNLTPEQIQYLDNHTFVKEGDPVTTVPTAPTEPTPTTSTTSPTPETQQPQPAKVEPVSPTPVSPEPVPHVADGSGEGGGTPTPDALVKGNTTFMQVLEGGITKEQIEGIIGAALPPTNQTVKDYCNQNGLMFSDIKSQLNALVQ